MNVYIEHVFFVDHVSYGHTPPTWSSRTHNSIGSMFISMSDLQNKIIGTIAVGTVRTCTNYLTSDAHLTLNIAKIFFVFQSGMTGP